jgi:hypothetical protein
MMTNDDDLPLSTTDIVAYQGVAPISPRFSASNRDKTMQNRSSRAAGERAAATSGDGVCYRYG